MEYPRSYLTRVRGVDLLPDERVDAILHTETGMVQEPPSEGRVLILTNHRLIDVVDDQAARSRQMLPVSAFAGVSVRNDAKQSLSWKQWAALIGGGIAVYLAVSYWLVDRLPYIVVPVLNLHAFALALMILLVLTGWLFWRALTQSGGQVMQIHGSGWSVEVMSESPYGDLMAFALALQKSHARRTGEARPQACPNGREGSISSDISASSPL